MSSEQFVNDWSKEVLEFWFKELSPKDWFVKNPDLDRDITNRFGGLYDRLVVAQPDECASNSAAALAAIIVLDQFPRNMFRGSSKMFATDPLALSLAEAAIFKNLDEALPDRQRQFVYMPFEHSEAPLVQARSVELFRQMGNADNVRFAIAHQDIIDRFGRFPHRNDVLDRASTKEEVEFLKTPGSSF